MRLDENPVLVVERGRHDDLLAAGGRYADLYRTQFADPTPHHASVAAGQKRAGSR